jgi:predicted transcriptional regulator
LTKSKIDEEPLSKETVEAIERGLKDIKEGRFYSTEEVKKRLNIK